MNVIIAYHKNCTDGLVAAAALNRQFDSSHNVNCIAVNYGVSADLGIPQVQNFSVAEADQIVFIDFCPEMDVLRTLLENEDLDVVILDHHDTALERLQAFPTHMYTNLTIILTKNLSGAGLAEAIAPAVNFFQVGIPLDANYSFQEAEVNGIKLWTNTHHAFRLQPDLISRLNQIVQGRDLWIDGPDKYQGIYFDAYLKFHDTHTRISPEIFYDFMEQHGGLETILVKGHMIFDTMRALSQQMLDNSQRHIVKSITLDTDVQVIIGNCIPRYASTFGELGYQNQELPTIVIGVMYSAREEVLELSLRCGKGVVVNKMADKLWGGGGHPKASGARWTTDVIDFEKIMNDVTDFILGNPDDVFISDK